MGCLNSNKDFNHWFGNIHLSGPCNRSCYFCIGQHMMDLDPLNNLDDWPLEGIDKFIKMCKDHGVNEINITGSNTDPLLYGHTEKLRNYLVNEIPNLVLGLRTNGVLSEKRSDLLSLYNKGSITICSLDPDIYKSMMGQGKPPDLNKVIPFYNHFSDLKLNVVLGPENVKTGDIHRTIEIASFYFDKINLREPYGQPHVGNPLEGVYERVDEVYSMPVYDFNGCRVCYWDVHYVEVESVNLYASGRVSLTYPITEGHSDNGFVMDQTHYEHGRHNEQWVYD